MSLRVRNPSSFERGDPVLLGNYRDALCNPQSKSPNPKPEIMQKKGGVNRLNTSAYTSTPLSKPLAFWRSGCLGFRSLGVKEWPVCLLEPFPGPHLGNLNALHGDLCRHTYTSCTFQMLVHENASTCIFVSIQVYTCIYMGTNLLICRSTNMYIHIYIYVYTCTCYVSV